MKKLALNKFQLREISKYWLNLSKLTFVSFILKLFEPQSPKFTSGSVGTLFWGLLFAIFFAILALLFSKKVKV